MKKGDKALNWGRSGQVWVETVVYTLIAFGLIGAVLAFARPEIQKMQDRALIDQSVEVLEEMNAIISSIRGTSGNVRVVKVSLKKGLLKIDPINNTITFEIESRAKYSEPGKEVVNGNMISLTEKRGDFNYITISTDYSDNYNLTYDGGGTPRIINKAPNPYQIAIENKGITDKVLIDIKVI